MEAMKTLAMCLVVLFLIIININITTFIKTYRVKMILETNSSYDELLNKAIEIENKINKSEDKMEEYN